jgi:type I restriction enzyme S subunit
VDERNRNLEISNLLGINISKNFMPSVANQTGLDLSKYKVVRKGRFACNIMHVGRDEKFPVSLYSEESPAIVSPAYMTFEVIDPELVLPEYLMMIFQKPEFDRYAWYVSDSSVRGGLEWDRFCEIEIPIPLDLNAQKDVVEVYSELLRNQKSFEQSLDDLQLICDTFIEDLTKKENLKRLGDYIEKVTLKNSDDKLKSLVGISEKKEFRLPAGKVNRENLSNHLIIHRGEFGYIPRMNPFKPLAIALSFFDYPVLLSPSYVAFKIVDTEILLPEFLFLVLKRGEFDRYAAYNAWSSTRDTFNWEDMCEVSLPIPELEVQKLIVAVYHVLEARKKINQELQSTVVPLCPVLLKGVVDKLSAKAS